MENQYKEPLIFTEYLHRNYAQRFVVDEVVFQQKSDQWELIIFKNQMFGTVMALDGIIQTTERDEFIYHEMMSHIPLFSVTNPKKVLVIGGGDGGIVREVLKHPSVEQVVLAEIDELVINMSKKYFPKHPNGAFENPKLKVVVCDAFDYVKNWKPADGHFDAIIADTTDPVGPGKILFTEEFYKYCSRALTPNGVMVAQHGIPFFELDKIKVYRNTLEKAFPYARHYLASIPTYIGGFMTLGFACNNPNFRLPALESLEKSYAAKDFGCSYYNPRMHGAAFCLPQYVQKVLGNNF